MKPPLSVSDFQWLCARILHRLEYVIGLLAPELALRRAVARRKLKTVTESPSPSAHVNSDVGWVPFDGDLPRPIVEQNSSQEWTATRPKECRRWLDLRYRDGRRASGSSEQRFHCR